jgi:hypothetical protein
MAVFGAVDTSGCGRTSNSEQQDASDSGPAFDANTTQDASVVEDAAVDVAPPPPFPFDQPFRSVVMGFKDLGDGGKCRWSTSISSTRSTRPTAGKSSVTVWFNAA